MLHRIKNSTPIFRYMDFDILVSLLFPTVMRFSSLRSMIDHTEGRWYVFPSVENPTIYQQVVDRTFVLCWTLNDPTSKKVWSEYTTPSKGIALETTFGKLKQKYRNNSVVPPLHLGVEEVQYTEYPIILTPSSEIATVTENILDIAKTKANRFAWEKEVRVIATQTEEEAHWDCVYGSMDVLHLTNNIHTCPDAEPWLELALERVLKARRVVARNHVYFSIIA